ncbi:MAG TPA: hypothetical protein VFM18_15940 [Methanosarcina sp.]|nr:hypothetical protein [Methanosarcina sp.]
MSKIGQLTLFSVLCGIANIIAQEKAIEKIHKNIDDLDGRHASGNGQTSDLKECLEIWVRQSCNK